MSYHTQNRGKYQRLGIALIPLVLILICTVSVFICAWGSNSTYSRLFLLPLVTGILLVFQFATDKSQGNMSFLIIGITYFVRNVISPSILVLDNYQSKFLLINQSNINNAVLIMLWETFAVTIFIKILLQRTYIKKKERYIYVGSTIYKIALLIGILVSMYALIGSAELRSSFFSIFTSNFYDTVIVSDGGSSALRNGGKVLIDALRLIFPITLIISIRRKYGQRAWTFLISFFISLLQVLFMTDGNMLIFLYVFVQLLLIYKIYPLFRSGLKKMMVILTIAGAFLMLSHRFLQADSAYSKSISVFMQSYLGGVCDVAGIFRLERSNLLSHMLIDLYSNVPFRRLLFGYAGNDLLTVNLYNAVNGAHAQILPTIAESYYFFGFLFSPILSMILVYIAWLFEQKAKSEDHYLYFSLYTLVYVIASISIVMYDMRIFIMDVLNIFIWMWIFIRLSKGVQMYVIEDL